MDAYDALPKVELHCHVEGTVRPSTVVALAREQGRTLPTEDPTDLYRYDSLDSFLAIFWLVQELIADRDAWSRVAYESVVDAAGHGLRYRETFFTPARHLAAGQRLAEIIAGLEDGFAAAEQDTGVRSRLVCDMDRAYGADAGLELVERLIELRSAGRAQSVIGVGMDSTERGVDLASFAPAYERARGAGLRVTGHAGEDSSVGPANVKVALDVLRLERIDHGIAVAEDEALMRRVATQRIPLTVCPNSNVVVANRYPSLAKHPLARMRAAGVLVTINTDDPAMIELDLGKEYRSVAAALELPFADMSAIALDGIEASWMDDSDKRAMRAAFEHDIAGIA